MKEDILNINAIGEHRVGHSDNRDDASKEQVEYYDKVHLKKRYVAFLDIIGFKNLVATSDKSRDDTIKRIRSLSKSDNDIITRYDGQIDIARFSDTIFVFTDGNTSKDLECIIKATADILIDTIKIGLPIKGVIAHGNAVCEKENQLFIGNPIVDAYELERQLKYLGIIFHHSAEQTLADGDLQKLLEEKKTPFVKGGKVFHLSVNWTKIWKQRFPRSPLDEQIRKLRLNSSGADHRIVFDNTIEYFELDKKRKLISTMPRARGFHFLDFDQ